MLFYLILVLGLPQIDVSGFLGALFSKSEGDNSSRAVAF